MAEKETVEVVVRASMHRWTVQRQRKARNAHSTEIWLDQGSALVSIDQNEGDTAPPPTPPTAPNGFKAKGWKEDPNMVFAGLPKAPAIGPPPETKYDPKEAGVASNSNDGEGAPPEGYIWTPLVRKRIVVEKIAYTMTYVFVEAG